MDMIAYFIGGVFLGAVVTLVAVAIYSRSTQKSADQQLRDAFAALSAEALSVNNERFLELARQSLSGAVASGSAELDKRRELIDKTVSQVIGRISELQQVTGRVENARKEDYGKLAEKLSESAKQVAQLRQTTDQLKAALAHPQRRGQWGERMASDILQMAGLIENVNYTCQQQMENTRKRPDFTFMLPDGMKLNMDVKFPLDRYLRLLEVPEDVTAAKDFISGVREQMRALVTREYIDPASGTVDFALMFIPNEQLFAVIHDHDGGLIAEAAQKKVLLVGPLSLLAVLAVIRQAAESANLSRSTNEALELIAEFSKQWENYSSAVDKLGERLDQARKQFDTVRTTRANVLERPVRKLMDIRSSNQGDLE